MSLSRIYHLSEEAGADQLAWFAMNIGDGTDLPTVNGKRPLPEDIIEWAKRFRLDCRILPARTPTQNGLYLRGSKRNIEQFLDYLDIADWLDHDESDWMNDLNSEWRTGKNWLDPIGVGMFKAPLYGGAPSHAKSKHKGESILRIYSLNEDGVAGHLVGYHGSQVAPARPDISRMKGADWGPGIYFASNIVDARKYGAFVFRAELRLDNPIRVRSGMRSDPIFQKFMRAIGAGEDDVDAGIDDGSSEWHALMGLALSVYEPRQLLAWFKKQGHDGIVVSNSEVRTAPGAGSATGDFYVVFDPAQVLTWERAEGPGGGGRSGTGGAP